MNKDNSKSYYRQQMILSYQSSSPTNERLRMIRLRRFRTESTVTYYDNDNFEHETSSKWSIVRQRLPDILAFSPTYKPTNVRTQLLLLVTLMNRQTKALPRLSANNVIQNITCLPTTVTVNMGDRACVISLKGIPTEQMIYVDVDGQSFSIFTRQFLIAISRGYAHETAAKFCPPAITDMLIELSKTKVVYDRRQYKRTLLKRRIGKMMFFSLFSFISIMIFALILSVGSTVSKLFSFNHSNQNESMSAYSSVRDTDEYWKMKSISDI